MKKILFISFIGLLCCNNNKISENKSVSVIKEESFKDYSTFHNEAKAYIKQNNFNKDFYYLIDLNEHSGKNRFFIYDFKTNSIIDKNLVTHGSCDQFEENPEKWQKVKFDVRSDSHCSMKGKYKIGKRDYSSWGINVKYWIHGLEETNSTAVKRVVVLHSWDAVKNEEIYPKYSPLSWGCPAVSNEFMKKIDNQLKQVEKPVLLWIM
ncbi:peptidase [Flavobacterium jejuense]|uniref:Peptidase n=1 Tax=Flavobacterium jejuense TaxID=1544455 RepID=A0ABX0IRP8_9FLAO|nr:murein L,D-transpeptidase catalytic domain family protein [Flavobacterium jejuense]NHN26241.1 peptidase [Flavobacterium jejuense]